MNATGLHSNRKCITVQHPPSVAHSNSLARQEVQWNRTIVSLPRTITNLRAYSTAHIYRNYAYQMSCERDEQTIPAEQKRFQTKQFDQLAAQCANAITIGSIAIGHS